MIHPCDKPCGNKTASGYCATTACINPQFSNIGTVQYGKGVQKRIVTNADRIRSMSDEELAHFLEMKAGRFVSFYPTQAKSWLDWLKQETKG